MAARFTSAYRDFFKRLGEIYLLADLASEKSSNSEFVIANALCRSGVVLLSSHIEGYLREVCELIISQAHIVGIAKVDLTPRFQLAMSRDLIFSIKQTADPDKLADTMRELFSRDFDVWSSHPVFSSPLDSRKLVDTIGVPNHDEIKSTLSKLGLVTFERDMARALGARWQSCENMIDQIVQQRNHIAHGDFTTAGSFTDLVNMTRYARRYCRQLDLIVAKRFRSLGYTLA